jgi:hypothetical protein
MKRLVLAMAMFFILLTASASWAAWTLTPSKVARNGHYLTWKVVCTSDGGVLSATDLIPLMDSDLKSLVIGSAMMIMKVSPGLTTVAPDTTIDVTLSDAQGTAIFVHTGYSNTADTTGISLAEDYNQYLPVHDKIFLTLNDIGTAGDQITLYFECWIE